MLAALSEKVKGVQDAEVIKALAIWRTIRFAIETSFSCVIIESDSLSVIKAIQDNEESSCDFGHIIEDVKHLSMAMKAVNSFTQRGRQARLLTLWPAMLLMLTQRWLGLKRFILACLM